MRNDLKAALATLALLTARPSPAADFDTRTAAAEAAIATPAGFSYDTAMVPAVHDALVPCVPKGTDPTRGGAFTLVADVDPTGRVLNTDVRPASPLALCFARRLATMRLRPPPSKPHVTAYPILVRMGLRP